VVGGTAGVFQRTVNWQEKENTVETRMADTAEIAARVRAFIVENFLFGDESTKIAEIDSFIKSGIIDSTGILELIDFLESTYGLTVDESETTPANLDSLGKVSAFVARKIRSN
jgi:acyl carrier protein